MDPIQLAAVMGVVVVLASMISVELGIAVALIELGLGVLVGNVFGIAGNAEWLTFIAGFASIVLTFLAGAEVDPDDFRERLGITVGIGVLSFVGPFVVAWLIAWGPLGWTLKAALIAGTALSTTSLAVVYAVLVESGLNTAKVGKLLMGACFVTDLGTALALSAIFITPNVWFPAFLGGSILLIVLLPKVASPFFRRYGDRVIEPEIKLVFVCLLALMVLAEASKGHAVLPAFILGLAMSRHYQQHRKEQERLRVVAFSSLTPFFFVKGGLNVSLGAVAASLGTLGILFAAKMVPKLTLVFPLARRGDREHGVFITLLMSTGLTFGTISSLYGLNAGIIDRTQFSLLVTVVVLSAVVPTFIAQRWFSPAVPGDVEPGPEPLPAEEFV
jgi:Kef-type K+ transport system membrane component KefB